MAFSMRTALDRIVTIQTALTITSPVADAVKRVYRLPPKGTVPLEPTCFMNSAELIQHERGMLRQRIYLVRMQLFVQDVDWDRAGDMAMAYQDKLTIALDNDLTLSIAGVPSCTLWRSLRGGPRNLIWNGVEMPGLDMFMDVVLGGEVPGT